MKHFFLVLAGLLSLVVISSVVFGWPPKIPLNADEERIREINSFLVNASLGVLTSIVFYYLLVFWGERKRAKEVRRLYQGKMEMIAYTMQIVIAYYADKCAVELKNKVLGLNCDSFKNVGSITDNTIDYWFHCPPGANCTWIKGSELGFLNHYCGKTSMYAKQLLDSPGFALEENSLIQLITNIKNSRFIDSVELLSGNKNVPIVRGSITSELSEYYQLFSQLLKYVSVDVIVNRGDLPKNSVPIVYN